VCFFPSSVLPVASIFSGDIDRPPLGVLGVGHAASVAASCKSAPPVPRSSRLLFAPPVSAFGVGQPFNRASVLRLLSLLPAALFPFCAGVPAMGVGHPVQPLSLVVRARAVCAQYCRPNGVTFRFHVCR
jgi:hypothetical protein